MESGALKMCQVDVRPLHFFDEETAVLGKLCGRKLVLKAEVLSPVIVRVCKKNVPMLKKSSRGKKAPLDKIKPMPY